MRRIFYSQGTAIGELSRAISRWSKILDGQYDSSRDLAQIVLDDPVIQHLLMNWTQDQQKLKLLSNWLKHVSHGNSTQLIVIDASKGARKRIYAFD